MSVSALCRFLTCQDHFPVTLFQMTLPEESTATTRTVKMNFVMIIF